MAAASGQSYFDYVRQHVFTPAGMEHTDFYTRPDVLAADDIARPYATDRETGKALRLHHDRVFPLHRSTGAYSTTDELLNFVLALRDGTLLEPAFAHLTTSGKVPMEPLQDAGPSSPIAFNGYGFVTSIAGDQRAFGHGGGAPGVSTSYNAYPDSERISVILATYDDAAEPIVRLERELITQQ